MKLLVNFKQKHLKGDIFHSIKCKYMSLNTRMELHYVKATACIFVLVAKPRAVLKLNSMPAQIPVTK